MSFKKIINIFLLIFFISFSIMICVNKFEYIPLISGKEDSLQIYELWHIETFEGGGGNRQNYLNSIAISYESSHSSKLFLVKSVSAEQLQIALQESVPDLISFAEDVASIVLPHLIELDKEHDIQTQYLDSARYNGKLMALPYIASGYGVFTKSDATSNLTTFTANNNSHSASHLINENINCGEILSSYQCYTKFINSKNVKLIGTARDLYRLSHLQDVGRINFDFKPISQFTDLIQYLGITNNSQDVKNFAEYLLQDNNQRKLGDIGLFSTKYLTLYTKENYTQLEQSLRTCNVPNIFN